MSKHYMLQHIYTYFINFNILNINSEMYFRLLNPIFVIQL